MFPSARCTTPLPHDFKPALCVSISSKEVVPTYGDEEPTHTRLTAWLDLQELVQMRPAPR